MNKIIEVQSKELFKIIKFAIIGVLNTLVNWVFFYILNSIGVYYLISNIIAYSLATIHSYFWNSTWVFNYNKRLEIKSSIKFIILNLCGLALNTFILFLLVDFLNINKFISLIFATVLVTIINYIFNKMWVFRKKVE